MTHPPRDALWTYARGGADFTRRLLIEAHLALCPRCPQLVVEYQEEGPRLPELSGSEELSIPSFDRVWAAVERVAARGRVPGAAALPPALLAVLPEPAGWHWVVAWPQRVRFALLARDAQTGCALYLSYYPPRSHFPRHRHLGLEENVILSGGYQNGDVHADAGDWVIGAPGTEHAPATGPDEECWCVSRIEPPGVRRSGWQGWLQRLLSRLRR